MPDHFESPRFLLEGAEKSILKFDSLYVEYLGKGQFREEQIVDPDTRHITWLLKPSNPLHNEIRHSISTALNDLKHCLDQAIYSATRALSEAPPSDRLYFPYAPSYQKLAERMEDERNGILPQLRETIAGIMPYPTSGPGSDGNDAIWLLSKSIGASKHRSTLDVEPRIGRVEIEGFSGFGLAEAMRTPVWSHEHKALFLGRTGPGGHMGISRFKFEFFPTLINAGLLSERPADAVIFSVYDAVSLALKAFEDRVAAG